MADTKIDAVVATPRTGTFNKNHARRVRVQGLIPAVVYGAGQESVPVTVDPKVITKILYSESGHNTIFDLTIEGKGGGKVMIVDWQHQGQAAAHRPEAHCHGQGDGGLRAGAVDRRARGREDRRRRAEPGAA
jgi:ribosomal protein L25 (general stress protein Ctc)